MTQEKALAALKPCPFCGTTEMLRRVGAAPGEGWSFVRCDYCDAEGPDPDNLPGHWNTRKSPDDDWTRWKLGESIDVLAKERGCTRERMRLRLKRLDEGRTVLALQAQLDVARKALAMMDHWAVIIRDDDGKHMSVPLRHYEAMRAALAATRTDTPPGAAG